MDPPPPETSPLPYTTLFRSLGAAALRIAGGIFTKIADIGSDLMKIVFNIKEDDLHEIDRKSTRLNSSHPSISYAVFCLKKKKKTHNNHKQKQRSVGPGDDTN